MTTSPPIPHSMNHTTTEAECLQIAYTILLQMRERKYGPLGISPEVTTGSILLQKQDLEQENTSDEQKNLYLDRATG